MEAPPRRGRSGAAPALRRRTGGAALEDLQRRASLSQPAYREALLEYPEAIELPLEHVSGGNCVVAEADGAVAGFAVVLVRDDGEAELDGLFVEPQRHRQGVGRLLVDAAAGVARQRGARTLFVIASLFAMEFYSACGFALTGQTPTRFGVALTMRLELRQAVGTQPR